MSWASLADQVLKATVGTFKTTGSYTRAEDPDTAISLAGVFNKPHQFSDPETGAPVSGTHPTFGIRLADLPADPEQGDTLEVGDKIYEVLDHQPDGQGGSELVLGRARST